MQVARLALFSTQLRSRLRLSCSPPESLRQDQRRRSAPLRLAVPSTVLPEYSQLPPTVHHGPDGPLQTRCERLPSPLELSDQQPHQGALASLRCRRRLAQGSRQLLPGHTLGNVPENVAFPATLGSIPCADTNNKQLLPKPGTEIAL